jgi:alkanesulfonate monooxygenase SsuD/methylene tetrahydromethanopterin reductase-like flavin-dependent oxidoreductase (luciferase family)
MQIGISVASAYNSPEVISNPRLGAQQMIDRTSAAAQAGLDSLFVGDHHVVPTPYFQNMPIMGRLLAEWHHKPAGVLVLLPLWNPVLVAEQVATLACLNEDRFILQCGLGRGEQQFKAMGANIKYRPSAFEQSLECLRALWRGESVSLAGRWEFADARISPLPPEAVEVWIGASADVAIARAARMGDAWLADPGLTLAGAEAAMSTYQQALQRHGQRTPATIAIRRDVYVAETEAEAAALRTSLGTNYRGFDPAALVIGDANEVAAEFQAFEKLGYTDIIVRNLHPEPASAVASTRRLKQVKLLVDNFF